MPPTVALIFMLSLLTFRLLTTVIHELGHAIPALLLTKDKVSVYMGSHGNPEKSMHFQIGRLECFFKFNLFYWRGGLCVMHDKDISVRTSFIVTIFGPLLSLIVAGITILTMYYGDFSDVVTLVLFALTFSCVLDFLNNIFPNRDTIELHDGTITNNDGMQLLMLIKYKNAYRKFQLGTYFLDNLEFPEAADCFEEALKYEDNEDVYYRLAIYAYLMAKNYAKAKILQEEFTEKYEDVFEVGDYANAGIIHSHFEEHEKSIEVYSKALKIDQKHVTVLNNRGYAYGLINKHLEAIEDFDKAIAVDQEYAFAWNNRGYSKLELGQLEDGLIDIKKSLELDDQNSYAHRNLGLYYYYTENYQSAISCYTEALRIDPETTFLKEFINKVSP
ncbi:tetratricopeptide repeat protein [Kordia sp.]|uniref:tetratricopeptide repeat protein n=1 Tax=Kordia sp. TaxID=1965332 RepID=UPI003B5C5F83